MKYILMAVQGKITENKTIKQNKYKENKKHSEDADTSTSVTFDLDVLTSRPRKLMSLDVAYWVVPWYQV